jgi:hypothetical protein
MKGGLRRGKPYGEGAARQALTIGAVARVDQLRSFGDLIANLAALAAAGLGNFIAISFSCGRTSRLRKNTPLQAISGIPARAWMAGQARP